MSIGRGGNRFEQARVLAITPRAIEVEFGEEEKQPEVDVTIIAKPSKEQTLNFLLAEANRSVPNPAILEKYGIQYFEYLREASGENCVVAIYTQDSKAYPLIEVIAENRIAAFVYFLNQEYPERQAQITTFANHYLELIHRFYEKPLDQDYPQQCTDLAALMATALDEMETRWKVPYQDKQFWYEMSKQTPAFRRTNILTLNITENVNTIEYYERGIRAGAEAKTYRSAHNRDAQGLANFAQGTFGVLNAEGQVILSHSDFRHASLPPIDLYSLQEDGRLNSARCISITSQNMQELEREIRKSKGHSPNPLTWVNVSVVTAWGKEKRIFQETILAADRLRARYNSSLNPVTFTFGINKGSTTWKIYPEEQEFENHRALRQLMGLCFKKLYRLDSIFEADIKNLGLLFDAAQGALAIDVHINQIAQRYHLQLSKVEASLQRGQAPSTALLREVDRAKAELIAYKKSVQGVLAKLIAKMMKAYHGPQAMRHVDCAPSLSPTERTIAMILNSLKAVLDLYHQMSWRAEENNIRIQALILNLVDHCGKLDELDANPNLTASSFNCKSDNDRATEVARHKGLIRAEERGLPVNKANIAMSSASSFIAVCDTGASSKYSGVNALDTALTEREQKASVMANHVMGKRHKNSKAKGKLQELRAGVKPKPVTGCWDCLFKKKPKAASIGQMEMDEPKPDFIEYNR